MKNEKRQMVNKSSGILKPRDDHDDVADDSRTKTVTLKYFGEIPLCAMPHS
jgi:hypothetical protein